MKKSLLFATAILALGSCTSETYLGTEEELATVKGERPISFGFNVPAPTRASGADAALALSNYFIVYGEKGEATNAKYSDGNLVFPNYTVKYVSNSANTTTSNTENWEYVGIEPLSTTKVDLWDGSTSLAAPSEQTIKYWDYGADSYTFTAVSAKPTDISSGLVEVRKNTTGASTVYDKGYTITLKEGADASKIYLADRKKITKTGGTNRYADNTYGGNVTFTFRNLLAQIRVGMYETIPGYQVNVDKFYYDNSADPAFSSMATSDATNNFYANLVHQAATGFTTDIILTVKYKENNSLAENQPTVGVTGGNATNYLTLGTNIANPAGTYIGETAAAATFDQSTANTYTTVFPQEANTTHDLKLKVDYTLYNSYTGETIAVTGATAVIPAEYLQWKANYKYTYLFKISQDTNGHAGGSSDPAGLYPITFDAEVVEAADGSEYQYITTVTDPSITTYANASNVTANNEYLTSSNIYVLVNDGVELTSSNSKLYIATIEPGASQPINEVTVANAIAVNSDKYDAGTVLDNGTDLTGYYEYNSSTNSYVAASGTADGSTKYYKNDDVVGSVKDANGKKLVVKNAAETLSFVNQIDKADTPDGIAIDVDGSTNKAAKFTPTAAGHYVFEYTDGSSKKHYKVIKVTAAP